MPITLNQSLQDRILLLMIEDDEFLAMVAGRIEPEFFLTSLSETLAKICLDYKAQFGTAPKDHFADEALRVFSRRSDDDKKDCLRYIQRLHSLPTPNREYLIRRISDAIKLKSRTDAAIQFAELIGQGKSEEADLVMYNALKSGLPEEEDALDYFRDLSGIADRGEHPSYLVSTGVPALDRVFGGFSRGQLVTILAGPKGGKTWSLQNIAREGLLNGLFVLHISHEVGKAEMELRYDQMFTGRGKRAGKIIELPSIQGGQVVPGGKKITVRSVFEADACRKGRQAVRRHGGRLLIKKYPMGQCKPAEVERLLDYLENYENFIPDIVINDYVDIMDLSQYGTELRHKINDGYIWSKGLADEHNFLMVTASQVNRDGMDRRHVRRKHVGEDIRKLANVDAMFAIGRSVEDVKAGLAGLSVLAARGEEQDTFCTFVPCFDIGQFCMESWLPSEVDENGVVDVTIDDEPAPASKPGRVHTAKEFYGEKE